MCNISTKNRFATNVNEEKDKMTKALAKCTSEMGLHGCDLAFVMAVAVAKGTFHHCCVKIVQNFNTGSGKNWFTNTNILSQPVSRLGSRKVN